MKAIKRIFLILLIVIILLPFVSYAGIAITNNCIADKIEKDLVKYQMPSDTELVDSVSAANKLTGNGNGMQYMGAILVKSALSAEELREYYDSDFDYIEVRKQESKTLDFELHSYKFSKFPEAQDGSYYSVICWDSNRKELVGECLSDFLDFDIRGH